MAFGQGRSGAGGTGPWDITIYTDKECRVFVVSITRSNSG